MSYFKKKIHKIIKWLIKKSDYQFKIKHLEFNTRSGCATVINSPTGNCQMYTIKKFDRLLHLPDIKFKNYIEESLYFTGKKILFLDINYYNLKTTLDKLNYCFDVIEKVNYKSTNLSSMVLVLLKYNPTKKIKDLEKQIDDYNSILTREPGESRITFFHRHSRHL